MFVLVEIQGDKLPEKYKLSCNPSKDIKVFGPFDVPEQAAMFANQMDFPEEKYVILRLEWQK